MGVADHLGDALSGLGSDLVERDHLGRGGPLQPGLDRPWAPETGSERRHHDGKEPHHSPRRAGFHTNSVDVSKKRRDAPSLPGRRLRGTRIAYILPSDSPYRNLTRSIGWGNFRGYCELRG